jgi:hypothetical protein
MPLRLYLCLLIFWNVFTAWAFGVVSKLLIFGKRAFEGGIGVGICGRICTLDISPFAPLREKNETKKPQIACCSSYRNQCKMKP